MNRTQRFVTVSLWSLVVVALVAVVASGMLGRQRSGGRGGNDHPRPDLAEGIGIVVVVPEFALLNQDAMPVTRADLLGKVWIADFIFTRCMGPCPMMTRRMAELQKDLPPAIRLISFSVDPEHDTPEVLRSYATAHEANLQRWHFLTGEKAAIYNIAAEMKLAAAPSDSQDSQIIHSTRFVLVDPQGKVFNTYDADDPQRLQRLITDARRLAEGSAATAGSTQP